MARLSKKLKQEWAYFINPKTGRRTYNDLCRKCRNDCKQSFRAIVVCCPLYRSLHLIIQIPIYLHSEKKMMKVEVQFRTISMDWWASLEHKIRYKKDVEVPLHIAKELRECAEEAALLDYRMENIQKNLGTYLKPDTQTPEQR